MEYKWIALLVVTLNVVGSNNPCGSEDLHTLFVGGVSQCGAEETWTFSHASINGDNDVSKFLTPGTLSSCITSHTLSLTGGGVIEVKVYTKSIQKNDVVSVTVYETAGNNVVGKAILDKNVEDGWNTLKMVLNGAGHYDGYIVVKGQASLDSVILLESVCYTSPSAEDRLPSLDKISKLTTNYRAPDVYILETQSLFTDVVNPKVATVTIAKEIDMNNGFNSEDRSMRFIDFEDFWTPLTISLAVIIPVLILVLLGWACFALGKRKGAQQEPQIIYEDVNTIPKPYLVPRVKNVYAESVTGSSYGGRNNIYSV